LRKADPNRAMNSLGEKNGFTSERNGDILEMGLGALCRQTGRGNRTGKERLWVGRMPFIYTTRLIFVFLSTLFAGLVSVFNPGLQPNPFVWASFGFFLSTLVVLVESFIRDVHPKALVFALGGLWLGFITASLGSGAIGSTQLLEERTRFTFTVASYLFLGYLGVVVALRYVERVDLSSSRLITAEEPRFRGCKILDSSVLIDGRICDMIETGFIEGIHVIPKFVLDELQSIADSPDSSRRQRGRRGLDVVRALKDTEIKLEIVDKDYKQVQAVDAKLIEMAKDLQGRIVTNDFNLNKVAEIHNIEVLNINDLANALKPVILPGETLRITLLKSGKEPGQGVGYLDDGTMVVVEDALSHLRKEVEVMVTSMLQTQAGRMIFGRLFQALDTLPS